MQKDTLRQPSSSAAAAATATDTGAHAVPQADAAFDPVAFDAAKRASTLQLLFRCARLMNERAVTRAAARYDVPIRAAHTALLPHIALDGTRQTDLAKKLGVTKQAVNQLVDDLESLGIIERVPDPLDRRAVLIRFTERGKHSMLSGLNELRLLESEASRAIGETPMRDLHRALTMLDTWLTDTQPRR